MSKILLRGGSGIPSADSLDVRELAIDPSTGALYSKLTSNVVRQLNPTAMAQVKTIADPLTRSTSSTAFVSTGIGGALDSSLQSTNSRVRIRFHAVVGGATTLIATFRLLRNGVDLTPSGSSQMTAAIVQTNYSLATAAFEFMDTPGAIAPATYVVQWRVNGSTAYLGRWSIDTSINCPSFLTLEEVL